MSSPRSSSSATAGRSPRLRRPRSSAVRTWGAAAVTTAALYALPWSLLFGVLDGKPWGVAAVVAVLGVVAWRVWSPLVVLGAGVLSLGGAFAFFLITAAGETCGGSGLADTLSWIGAAVLALPLGTVGVRRGAWVFAAVPAGWVAAGCWSVLVAHLVHGGTGGCFQ